jgi:predicted DNA-binding transcriptional regulator YafY
VDGERGRGGGYSLRRGFRLPPLMFTVNEITAVMLGLMLMREVGPGSNFAIESAASKIERVLPEELAQCADALREAVNLDAVGSGRYTVASEQIVAFSQAVYSRTCLDIGYEASSGQVTERRIAPYGLVLHARAWYVPAYCFLREDLRVFRLDRVCAVSRTDQPFERPEPFDATAAVIESLKQLPNTTVYEVLIYAPAETVQTLLAPGLAVLESEGDNTLMRCYSDDAHWLARVLARLEVPFSVRQTDELRTALRTLAADLVRGADLPHPPAPSP